MLTIGRSLKKDDFVVILFFVRIAKNTILIESISAKANFMLNIKKVATVLSSIHTERRGGGCSKRRLLSIDTCLFRFPDFLLAIFLY